MGPAAAAWATQTPAALKVLQHAGKANHAGMELVFRLPRRTWPQNCMVIHGEPGARQRQAEQRQSGM